MWVKLIKLLEQWKYTNTLKGQIRKSSKGNLMDLRFHLCFYWLAWECNKGSVYLQQLHTWTKKVMKKYILMHFFSVCVSLNSRPVGDTMARSEGAVLGVSLRTNFDKRSVSASWQGPSVCLRMWQLVHPISDMMALTIKTQQEFVVVQPLHICLLLFTCQLFSRHCKRTVASLMDHKYGVMCGTLPIPIHLLAPLPNICPIKWDFSCLGLGVILTNRWS